MPRSGQTQVCQHLKTKQNKSACELTTWNFVKLHKYRTKSCSVLSPFQVWVWGVMADTSPVAAHSFEWGLTQRELPPGEGNEQSVASMANISLGFCNVSNVYMYRV